MIGAQNSDKNTDSKDQVQEVSTGIKAVEIHAIYVKFMLKIRLYFAHVLRFCNGLINLAKEIVRQANFETLE